MHWYHWIAVWLIIIAGITFTIIPDKPWWLWLSIFACAGLGLLLGVLLPHKEDKYANVKKKGS